MTKITQDHRDQVRKMIDWGYCMAAIIETTKLNDYYVRKIISEDRLKKPVKMTGIPVVPRMRAEQYQIKRGRIRWAPDLVKLIERLRQNGRSWDEIARTIGLADGGKSMADRYRVYSARVNQPKQKTAEPTSPVQCWWGKKLMRRLLQWLDGPA